MKTFAQHIKKFCGKRVSIKTIEGSSELLIEKVYADFLRCTDKKNKDVRIEIRKIVLVEAI